MYACKEIAKKKHVASALCMAGSPDESYRLHDIDHFFGLNFLPGFVLFPGCIQISSATPQQYVRRVFINHTNI